MEAKSCRNFQGSRTCPCIYPWQGMDGALQYIFGKLPVLESSAMDSVPIPGWPVPAFPISADSLNKENREMRSSRLIP